MNSEEGDLSLLQPANTSIQINHGYGLFVFYQETIHQETYYVIRFLANSSGNAATVTPPSPFYFIRIGAPSQAYTLADTGGEDICVLSDDINTNASAQYYRFSYSSFTFPGVTFS